MPPHAWKIEPICRRLTRSATQWCRLRLQEGCKHAGGRPDLLHSTLALTLCRRHTFGLVCGCLHDHPEFRVGSAIPVVESGTSDHVLSERVIATSQPRTPSVAPSRPRERIWVGRSLAGDCLRQRLQGQRPGYKRWHTRLRRGSSSYEVQLRWGAGGAMHEFVIRVLRLVVGPTIFGFALSLCALLFGICLEWRG
jgi:hypothetical protein